MASQQSHDDKTDLLVDSGCTSHMAIDESLFTEFDESFKPELHSLTLADGTKCSGMAEKRGKVEATLTDSNGVVHSVSLNDVLYVPNYPQNMFSVHKANEQKAAVVFLPNSAQLIAPDGTKFDIRKERGLFWLKAGIKRKYHCDSVNSVRDLKD